MPVFALNQELLFPPPELANSEGILAVGGDLSPERLLLAYRSGIFPWFSDDDPIIWWSPDPRCVLYPSELKVSKSMKQILRSDRYQVSYDRDFPSVIRQCKKVPRKGQGGTWITPDMEEAYITLHNKGFAHSVEVWQDDELAGGLYGVSLGNMFFGESMFTKASNASKTGFISLVRRLQEKGFGLIDCQVYNSHLASLGARDIPRRNFLAELRSGLEHTPLVGNWGEIL